MVNPFLEAIYFKHTYECGDETVELTNEETYLEGGKYFVVVCDKCSNIPVFHLLRKIKGGVPAGGL